MASNASRIRTYRLPPGNAARATRAVSSGIGSGFRACSDILASNPSDFPGSAGYARLKAADAMPAPGDQTAFATSIESEGEPGSWLLLNLDDEGSAVVPPSTWRGCGAPWGAFPRRWLVADQAT